jgi:hypothetical protein
MNHLATPPPTKKKAPCQDGTSGQYADFQAIAIKDALLTREMRQDCARRTVSRSKIEQRALRVSEGKIQMDLHIAELEQVRCFRNTDR